MIDIVVFDTQPYGSYANHLARTEFLQCFNLTNFSEHLVLAVAISQSAPELIKLLPRMGLFILQ